MVYPDSGVTAEPSIFDVGGTQLSIAVPVVAGVTVTVALWEAEPPVPVQLNV